MIFRLSQKIHAKIKTGPLPLLPLDANPFADWSAHLFTSNRSQYILLTNTKSLYSTIMLGKGITTDRQFISRALDTIQEFMQHDRQQSAYRQFIAPAAASVVFAKALNRSVTGSMNELILEAASWLTEGDLSPENVGLKLNHILLSSLPGPGGYGTPREAFHALLPAATTQRTTNPTLET